MMADIFHPIFTLTITVLACFIRKKTKLFRSFAPKSLPRHPPRPPGGLQLPLDPQSQLQSFLALPKNDAPIFFLYYPLPVAPNKIEIKREMLSDYQLKIADLYNILIGNVKKLVPNFFDKEKYVIHYENLQLYLRLGLKLKKYIVY